VKARAAAARGGFAGAACVACCAPPIIAALGATAGVAATLGIFVGLAGAVTAVLVGGTWVATRMRRPRAEALRAEPIPVAAPTRRIDR
jgi:hypothetical protein